MLHLLSQPLYIIDSVIAAASVALVLALQISILRQRDTVRLASLEEKVNMLLPIGLVVMFIAILQMFLNFYRAPISIMTSGTGDPRILVVGVIQEFLPLFLFLLITVFILLAWFVLRTVLQKKLTRLEADRA